MHASCISATTRPARRILAISSLLLRIAAPPEPAVDGPDQAGRDLVGVADAVDSDQLVPLHVPRDQGSRLLLVELEAAADGTLGVVRPLDDLAAADVARPGVGGWLLAAVVGAALDADPAGRQALEHHVGRHLEVD